MAQLIIPWRGGDPHRERARNFLKRRYKARLGGWDVSYGELALGTWCKAEAVQRRLRTAPSGIVAIVDADVWTDGLPRAATAVTCGVAEWAVPHRMVYRLTEEASRDYMAGKDVREPLERRAYEGVWGGGAIVAHRDTLLKVPLDSRFRGMDAGHEDEAWGMALETLCGPGWRGDADLIHLHHVPRPRLSARKGSLESWDLYRRYAIANRNPEAITELIEETR